MAVQTLSFSGWQRKNLSTGTDSHLSITLSQLSIQHFHKKTSVMPSAFIKVPSQAYRNFDSKCQLESSRTVTTRSLSLTSCPSSAQAVKALRREGGDPRRLVDVFRSIPRMFRAYLKNPFRRALCGGLSLFGGFYVAQIITLSFGTLKVNDVIAAALCVIFAEYVTKYYITRTRVNFATALLNNFKIGFTYGLFMEAFKLPSG